jgi:hypothetical protein
VTYPLQQPQLRLIQHDWPSIILLISINHILVIGTSFISLIVTYYLRHHVRRLHMQPPHVTYLLHIGSYYFGSQQRHIKVIQFDWPSISYSYQNKPRVPDSCCWYIVYFINGNLPLTALHICFSNLNSG